MKLYQATKYHTVLVLLLLASSCLGPSLSEYIPKTEEEREITSLLIKYQDARKQLDLDQFIACLHGQGKFSFESNLMISKERLKELLPTFWAESNLGSLKPFPTGHHVNGNFFPYGEFYNPKIVVDDNTAIITVTFNSGLWKMKHYIFMLKETNQWLIARFDWGGV